MSLGEETMHGINCKKGNLFPPEMTAQYNCGAARNINKLLNSQPAEFTQVLGGTRNCLVLAIVTVYHSLFAHPNTNNYQMRRKDSSMKT